MATTLFQAFNLGCELASRVLVKRSTSMEENSGVLRLLQAISDQSETIVDSATEDRIQFAEFENERNKESESPEDTALFDLMRLCGENAEHLSKKARREHQQIANDVLVSLRGF